MIGTLLATDIGRPGLLVHGPTSDRVAGSAEGQAEKLVKGLCRRSLWPVPVPCDSHVHSRDIIRDAALFDALAFE